MCHVPPYFYITWRSFTQESKRNSTFKASRSKLILHEEPHLCKYIRCLLKIDPVIHYFEYLDLFLFDVCLMVFNATFNNTSAISWDQFYWWRTLEDPGKTTDLSQVTDTLYHILLYTSPWSKFELTTSVVIGTDCIGSCKSTYHTITTTTAPPLRISRFGKKDSIMKNIWYTV